MQHFIRRLSDEEAPTREVTLTQEAIRRLMAYDWPGNIRQLENAIERALALGGNRPQIDVGDLPPELQRTRPAEELPLVPVLEDGFDMPTYIATIERQLIRRALDDTSGNRQRAAERRGLKRTTLVEKVRRLKP